MDRLFTSHTIVADDWLAKPCELNWTQTVGRKDYPVQLVVHCNHGAVRQRRVSLIDVGVERRLWVNGKSVGTLAQAVYGRVLKYYDGDVWQDIITVHSYPPALDNFRNRLLASYDGPTTPITREEFASCYKGRRHTIYSNAVESLGNIPLRRRDAYVKMFVKCEKVKRTGCPRVIQPRDPRYNVCVGVYLKKAEHSVYKAIARCFRQRVVVAKGLNVVELGEVVEDMWWSIPDPCYIGLDASRFDMHVTVPLLKWEHSVYNRIFNSPDLARMLRWQLVTRGKGWCDDGFVKYTAPGRRMSGDMNTGMGNCLIMCGMLYTLKKKLGIPLRVLNNGDDCGIIVSKRYSMLVMEAASTHFLPYGFRIKVEQPVCDIEAIRFCQMAWIRRGRSGIMVRDYHTAIEKDSIATTFFQNEKVMRKWLYSVGECGLSLCSGIPVMQEFYKMYMRNGLPSHMSDAVYMECGARFLARGLASKNAPVRDETRASFYSAFDLDYTEQKALETKFRNTTIKFDGGTPCYWEAWGMVYKP